MTGVSGLVADGMVPAGCYRNRDHYLPLLGQCGIGDDDALLPLFDPQTSGGLLIALAPEDAARFRGFTPTGCGIFARRIGEVLPLQEHSIEVTLTPMYAIAIDLGTTTLAASLLELASGKRLAMTGSLNPQRRFGADVVSRLDAAVNSDDALKEMSLLIRAELYAWRMSSAKRPASPGAMSSRSPLPATRPCSTF